VAPERLGRWLQGFADRHGEPEVTVSESGVSLRAPDGAVAAVEVPFPPLAVDPALPWGGLVEHALAERTVGVFLLRLGGFAVGVFDGPRLTASKVGSRPVHGRAAAGGWSQKRFARRREAQAHAAVDAAVEAATRILGGAPALDAVVLGGDRRALRDALADDRLAPLRSLTAARVLDVPDPNRRVLEGAHALLRQVHISITEP
jgi:hypothetical protein